MPKIAIAPCSKLHDYEESVRRAGGDVHIVMSENESPMDVVANSDGILLAGGGDVSYRHSTGRRSIPASTRRKPDVTSTSSNWCDWRPRLTCRCLPSAAAFRS